MGMRTTIIAALIVSQLIFGCPAWLADCTWRPLIYHFFHANIFHLAANSLAIWTIYAPNRKDNIRNFLTAYLIAVIVTPLSLRPCIGISNIIFAAIALRTPSLRSSYWKQPPVILFLALMLLFILIPQFSATTHIAAFAVGILFACIRRNVKTLNDYAGRYL